MRALVLILALAGCGSAPAQRWEKPLAPGLVYRMEVDPAIPRVVHALRFARDAEDVSLRPELAQAQVFAVDDEAKGRAPLSRTIERTGAIAGVNADFFPWSGDPLGTMVREGELVSRPFRGRSVFAWGPGVSTVTRLDWTAEVALPGGQTLKLDGLNEEAGQNALVLTTPAGGASVTGQEKSVTAYISVDGTLTPNGSWSGKILTVVEGEKRAPVGKGQFALTATGTKADALRTLDRDQEVAVKVAVTGLDWARFRNVVGGGPVIVSQGKPIQSWTAEDFRDDFATRRHPRTAVGATASGDVWLVVVEGRQSHSAGATLDELGRLMARLGCTEAVNLDGGGSSQLSLRGMVVNKPSDGQERPIANSILAFAKDGWGQGPDEFVVQGAARATVGQQVEYRAIDGEGRTVPNARVVWAAQGEGWIDQGGRLRAVRPGRVRVTAWVAGRTSSVEVTLVSAKPPAETR